MDNNKIGFGWQNIYSQSIAEIQWETILSHDFVKHFDIFSYNTE